MINIQGQSISQWVNAILNDNSKMSFTHALLSELSDERDKHERLKALHVEHRIPIYEFQKINTNQDKIIRLDELIEIPNYDGFAIRAVPLQSRNTKLHIVRAQGLSLSQCEEFILSLRPSVSYYSLSINSYFVPQYSGNIIVQKNGLIVELGHGRHFNLNQQRLNDVSIYFATMTSQSHTIFYNTTELNVRRIIWQILTILMKKKTINPLTFLEDLLNGYFEFVYHEKHGYRIIDYRKSNFWCSLPFE